MNSLSKLINQGVPNIKTTYWGKETPYCCCCNPINIVCRNYNNIYGTITNTHMDIFQGDKGILTGSLVSNQKEFNTFMCNRIYLGVDFEIPFIEWIESQGYDMNLSVVNGQMVYIISPKNTEEQ